MVFLLVLALTGRASHDREVVVLDLDSGTVLGRVPGKTVHGIAIARELGRGFISSGIPGSVIIFDLKTLATIQEVPGWGGPQCCPVRS